ncbi:MAG: MFS transporter [Alphaproteobacteria bacterium]|nr:MFS transporter [Alphaproteobacteria bacterium]
MNAETRSNWGAVSVSAGVLSLALLGDTLLYVVLPVNAAAFGIGLVWVGVLLAANRLTRIVLYGAIAAFGEAVGPKNLTIMGAGAAALSTLMLWGVDGGPLLLAARILWGLSFAGLSLAALSYAVADKSRAGSRVGVSRSIQQIGPTLSLSVGAWYAGVVGPREIFLILGVISLAALPLALLLPKEAKRPERKKTIWLPRPVRLDMFFFVVGFAVDGVFVMTIALVLTKTVSAETAVFAAGLILALRRFSEILLSPLAGAIGDRVGTGRLLFLATLLLASGFALLAIGQPYAGSALVIAARAAIATVGPAIVAQRAPENTTMYRLAVMQTWRDFGAAVGPLVTGALLEFTEANLLYWGLVVVVLLSLAVQRRPGREH